MAKFTLKSVPVQQSTLTLTLENLSDKERKMLYQLGNFHDSVAKTFFLNAHEHGSDRDLSFNEKELSKFLLSFYENLRD